MSVLKPSISRNWHFKKLRLIGLRPLVTYFKHVLQKDSREALGLQVRDHPGGNGSYGMKGGIKHIHTHANIVFSFHSNYCENH